MSAELILELSVSSGIQKKDKRAGIINLFFIFVYFNCYYFLLLPNFVKEGTLSFRPCFSPSQIFLLSLPTLPLPLSPPFLYLPLHVTYIILNKFFFFSFYFSNAPCKTFSPSFSLSFPSFSLSFSPVSLHSSCPLYFFPSIPLFFQLHLIPVLSVPSLHPRIEQK